MKPRFYETKDYTNQRDTLCKLLNQGAELLEEQPNAMPSWKSTAQQFREKRRKLNENQFTIALLAEMQAGKSTLFDTVACGGREFSPVGSLVRTSGCPIIGQNLENPKERERAEIEWRTDEELVIGFNDRLLRHLAKLAPARFGSRKNETGEEYSPSPAKILKLSEATDRALLRQAAELEREQWRRSPADYEALDTALGKKGGGGDLDVLRFALLVAEFYSHPEIMALRQKRDFEPGEARSYVRYPADWQSRWISGEPNKFDWNEVIFIFVRCARYYLHSPQLAKIGCTLVDCPGLNASDYDTAIARETMKSADAILYLIPGDRQIGQSDLQVLRDIRTNQMEHKLFFAWNIKGTSERDAQRLLLNLKSTLMNDGFKAATEDYVLIHAGLALRGDQAHALLDGTLDAHTLQAIAERDGEPLAKVPDRIWKDIARFRRTLENDEDVPIGKDLATALKARELGRVGNFVGNAEEFVVGRGALSILVANGSEAVIDSLSEVESDLKQREARAASTLAEHEAKFREATKTLGEFKKKSARTLERLEATDPDDQLADDFLARLDLDLRKQISHEIAVTLDNDTLTLRALAAHTWESIKTRPIQWFRDSDTPSETDLERAVKKICSENIQRPLQSRFTKWQDEIERGQNQTFERVIGRRVKAVNDELEEDWKLCLSPDQALLEGFKPPRVKENLKEAFDASTAMKGVAATEAGGLGTNVGTAAGGVIAGIVAWTAGTHALTVLGFTIFTSTAPWMWPVIAAASVAAILGLRGVVTLKSGRQKKLQEKVDSELAKKWPELKEGIRPEIRKISEAIRTFYRGEFHKSVGLIGQKLAARKAEADLQFRGSQAQRDAVASSAREFRTKKLEPLRRELEMFSKECREALIPS